MKHLRKYNESIEDWSVKQFIDMLNINLEDNTEFEILDVYFNDEDMHSNEDEYDNVGRDLNVVKLKSNPAKIAFNVSIIERFSGKVREITDNYYKSGSFHSKLEHDTFNATVEKEIRNINKIILSKLARKYDFSVNFDTMRVSPWNYENSEYEVAFNVFFSPREQMFSKPVIRFSK